tara:strand:- start:182 stop:1678 length:1497 start_codon:yes stop_codon:yes gene_type:complete
MSSLTDSTPAMAARSSEPSPSNVPDLLRVGTIPDNTTIEVETDVLDSVVFNQSFCRFQLQNKGILHSNSKITLSASIVGASTDRAFFPAGVGVFSLIDRAVLKVGTKTLCEVEDFAHFQGYQSLFVSGEHNKEREQYTTARLMNHEPFYDNGTLGALQSAGNASVKIIDGQSNHLAKEKGVQVDVDLDCFKGDSDYLTPDLPGNVVLQPFQTLGENPVFQVNLSDLFPFLRTSQLPLYMMKEPVSLELFWTARNASGRFSRPQGATQDKLCDIVQTKCQMVADYIYYPQEIMESYQRQNPSLSFTYVDYRLAKRTVTTASAKNLILNIGGAGRICNKVFSMISKDATTGDSPLNNYEAIGPSASLTLEDDTSINGSLTSNLRYNDNFLYPVDVDNTARHFHNVVQAEGKVPFVVRQEYSGEGLVLGGELEGHDQATALTSKFFYIANRLNRNERVNSRGIEAYTTYDSLEAGNHTIRYYIELMRLATLRDGMMEIAYA